MNNIDTVQETLLPADSKLNAIESFEAIASGVDFIYAHSAASALSHPGASLISSP
ncbi:hypothetical protein [Granulicella sp. S156]|jgi:hypothetical protein|uniref:hypothetical protein n=1 Tax=Granulicella sp. S156 TaxID=1747224 RepID=UPI00131D78C1|nr:hypothetical protein [Granulicella sp. S156]